MNARPSHVSWFRWHVVYSIQDFRSDVLGRIFKNTPAAGLLLCDVREIPGLIGQAEYCHKCRLWQAPLSILRQAEAEASAWLS
jgi:hypothetical protein